MLRTKIKYLAVFLMLVTSFAAAEDITVKEVAVSVMDAYIPNGLKGGDDAYVVVNGLFPNSCYTLERAEVKHISDFSHQIRTIAKVRSGICLRVLVPYNKEISLGALKSGVHTLKFSADDDTYFEKTMTIN